MKRVLGQGLDALFSKSGSLDEEASEKEQGEVRIIKTSLIEPRRDQPRKNFDREQLQALANSISEHGVIQPEKTATTVLLPEKDAGERQSLQTLQKFLQL